MGAGGGRGSWEDQRAGESGETGVVARCGVGLRRRQREAASAGAATGLAQWGGGGEGDEMEGGDARANKWRSSRREEVRLTQGLGVRWAERRNVGGSTTIWACPPKREPA